MAHDDDPPELAGYVPSGGKPLRHPMTMRVMRVMIVLGLLGLVVPTLFATIALQIRTAETLCARSIPRDTLGADPIARFELAGPAGPSWYCYAKTFDGHEVLVGSLGLIPG